MKQILGLALCAMMMASCQKETDTVDLSSTQLSASTVTDESAITLNSNEENGIYELGRKHKPLHDTAVKRIPVDQLPQAITDYITANYPDAKTEMAFRDRDGNVYVLLKFRDGSVKMLQFDANGNFVKELDRKPRRPGNHDKRLTKLDPSTLSSTIVSYIDTNYAGATIEKAGTTATGETVVFISLNGDRKALLFDVNGNFVKELK
jgi:hypothetical protein